MHRLSKTTRLQILYNLQEKIPRYVLLQQEKHELFGEELKKKRQEDDNAMMLGKDEKTGMLRTNRGEAGACKIFFFFYA